MAHYAIGDIQGCHAEFCELLDLIAFSPGTDRLWLVGDLVNRGPESLAVLREVMRLGRRRRHRARQPRFPPADDRRQSPQAASRRHARRRPRRAGPGRPDRVAAGAAAGRRRGRAHARARGSAPAMDARDGADALARGAGACWPAGTRTNSWACCMATNRGNGATTLTGYDRLRVAVNACTRLRFCTGDGTMEFREKRGAAHAPRWLFAVVRASRPAHRAR